MCIVAYGTLVRKERAYPKFYLYFFKQCPAHVGHCDCLERISKMDIVLAVVLAFLILMVIKVLSTERKDK